MSDLVKRLRDRLDVSVWHDAGLINELQCPGVSELLIKSADTIEKLRTRISAIEDVVSYLKQWISDCQSGMYVNCVYCGHRYGPVETTPCSLADVLKQHISVCPEHPMSALKKEYESLKAKYKECADFADELCKTYLGGLPPKD